MRINSINTYILLCLLEFGHRNFVVRVRADRECGSTDQTSGSGSPPVTTPPAGGTSPTSGTEDKGKKSTECTKKTGVDVCIHNNKNATSQFDYNKSGQVVTYTAKGDHAFKLVKQKETEIWKAKDESEYATKVVLDGKGKKEKTITIDKLDDHKVLCVREGKDRPWQSFDLSKNNKVSINIGYKSDSFKYTNKLVGETRTFEAKDKFIFNQVRCYINKTWIDIWKTDDENEYSKKVEAEGDTKVTIHFENGGTKVFKKGSDKKWTEDTASSKKGSGTHGSGGTDQSGGGTTGTG